MFVPIFWERGAQIQAIHEISSYFAIFLKNFRANVGNAYTNLLRSMFRHHSATRLVRMRKALVSLGVLLGCSLIVLAKPNTKDEKGIQS